MTKKEKTLYILNYLDRLFPNAGCELKYTSDYGFLIAVMLSAQTTDVAVNKVTEVLFSKYKTIEELANASYEDICEIIKKIGLFKVKARNLLDICKVLIEKHNGKVPSGLEDLLSLPGVGIKTAGVVRAELFHIPDVPVDTHVERVSKRLGLVNKSDTPIEINGKLKKLIPLDLQISAHHKFIHFGRYFCLAKKPNCDKCELRNICKN